jgi:putative PEP-CTERM system TPR-repeat lipoprotein
VFANIAAEAYARLGDLDKSAELFGKVAEQAGPGSVADEKRAIARLAAGDKDAALADFERIAQARKGVSNADIAVILGHLRKDPAKAITLIDALDRKVPKQPFLYNLKGLALLQKGEKDAAVAAFDEALKIQPSFLPAAANLFKLDIAEGKLEQGRQRFLSVLKADANHYQALLALAEVEQTTGKLKEAIPLLKRATNAQPQQPEAWARLINLQMRRGEHEEALQAAQDFLAKNPNSFIATELMGKVQLAQGDANSAVATYARLTTDHPKSEQAHLLLAEAQLQSKRVADAERSLRRVLEINPDHRQGQLAWVGLMVKEKRGEEARRFAQALQKERPKSAAGWVLEADLHWAQARFADAAKALNTALAIAPRQDLAIRRFEAQSRADDTRNGLAGLRQFVDKHPSAIDARVYLAGILARSNDFAGAVQHYEPAAKVAGVNPMVLNNLAYALYKLNDPRAIGVGEEALRAVPDNPVILDTLGLILTRDGDSKRAVDLLERAVKKKPNQPEIRFHLAAALHRTGDNQRARSELRELLQKHKSFPEREQAVALLKAIDS